MKIIFLLAFIALAGYATSKRIMGPNGTVAHSISCPRSMEVCYEKAAEVCPAGYSIINSNNESTFFHNTYSGQVTPYQRHNMFVECS